MNLVTCREHGECVSSAHSAISLLSLSPGSSPIKLKESGIDGMDVGGEGEGGSWAEVSQEGHQVIRKPWTAVRNVRVGDGFLAALTALLGHSGFKDGGTRKPAYVHFGHVEETGSSAGSLGGTKVAVEPELMKVTRESNSGGRAEAGAGTLENSHW